MARISLGDVFEISTPEGKAYLHYVYKDKTVGELVRVLPGLYPERPEDLDNIVSKDELYVVFFPLSYANKRRIVERVGNFGIDFKKPKYMREKHVVRSEFIGWHIIDTDTWERELVNTVTKEQSQLSPWGIWNDTLLVERLVEEWTPEEWN